MKLYLKHRHTLSLDINFLKATYSKDRERELFSLLVEAVATLAIYMSVHTTEYCGHSQNLRSVILNK